MGLQDVTKAQKDILLSQYLQLKEQQIHLKQWRSHPLIHPTSR